MTASTLDATYIPAPLLDTERFDPPASSHPVAVVLQGLMVLVAAAFVALALVPPLLGYHGQVVLSGSMQPRLHVGDVTYLKQHPVGQLRVGQIVTFPVSNEGRVVQVTHRIVAIHGTVLTTKGDANPAYDPFTTQASQVKGTYAFAVPRLGTILELLRNRTGYFLVAGLVFGLVVLREGRVLVNEYRGWRGRRQTPER